MNEFGIAGYLYHKPLLHERTMTLTELPGVIRKLDLGVLELCSVFFEQQSAAYLAEVRKAIDDAGLKIPGIAVDRADISLEDDTERFVHLEAIKQWFHVAQAVGATAIRVNSGGTPNASDAELARIVEGYRTLADYAEREGIFLLIENHGGASYQPAAIQHVLDEVGSTWFRTCPDTGNYPDNTWEEGIRVMAPHAHSTHIKVTAYSEDGWQPRTGRDGSDRTVNLKVILQTLATAGYAGPLCIEAGVSADEGESALGAIAYVKELLAES